MYVVGTPQSSESPEPATKGCIQRCSSSSCPPSRSARLNGPVPYFSRVLSPSFLSRATASTASPCRTSAFQVVSVSVCEATYLGSALSLSAMAPVWPGHVSANTS
jgi:hypothetical protein